MNGSMDFEPPRIIKEKFPVTLPMELALRVGSIREICESYGITQADWDKLRRDPALIKATQQALNMLEQEGMSFRTKARLQAEELLKTSWGIIHNDDAPAAVKADLIKSTIKWADYEPKPNATTVVPGSGFSIQINLGQNMKEVSHGSGPVVCPVGAGAGVGGERLAIALPGKADDDDSV